MARLIFRVSSSVRRAWMASPDFAAVSSSLSVEIMSSFFDSFSSISISKLCSCFITAAAFGPSSAGEEGAQKPISVPFLSERSMNDSNSIIGFWAWVASAIAWASTLLMPGKLHNLFMRVEKRFLAVWYSPRPRLFFFFSTPFPAASCPSPSSSQRAAAAADGGRRGGGSGGRGGAAAGPLGWDHGFLSSSWAQSSPVPPHLFWFWDGGADAWEVIVIAVVYVVQVVRFVVDCLLIHPFTRHLAHRIRSAVLGGCLRFFSNPDSYVGGHRTGQALSATGVLSASVSGIG
mmetsp:Transcript_22500/g.70606  ORF Transcript_22500/g.70606 Transcript_22500/m.70606 type:complete len:289 (-) Transcript_22500:1166-2032(-)